MRNLVADSQNIFEGRMTNRMRNPWNANTWDAVAQYRFVQRHGRAAAVEFVRANGGVNSFAYSREPFAVLGTKYIGAGFLMGVDVAPVLNREQVLTAAFNFGTSMVATIAGTAVAAITASFNLGFAGSAATNVIASITANAALGFNVAVSFSSDANLSAAFSLGLTQSPVLQLERDIAAAFDLGFLQSESLMLADNISMSASLGFDTAVALSFEQMLTVAPATGISMAATLNREVNLSAQPSVGMSLSALVGLEKDLTAAMGLGFTETAAPSLERDLVVAASLGFSHAATITTSATIVPAVTTFTSGSGNFTVPAYDVLVVECIGGGSGTAGVWDPVPSGVLSISQGGNGGTSSVTVGATNIVANGATSGARYFCVRAATTLTSGAGATGGTATGGDLNITGAAGGGATGTVGTSATGGNGNAGSGNASSFKTAAGGTDSDSLISTRTTCTAAGGVGAPPSGAANKLNGGTNEVLSTDGGAAGGYSRKIYVNGVTVGAPSVGDSLAYAVGAGGTTGVATQSGLWVDGAAGNGGQVRFSVFANTNAGGNDSKTKLLLHFEGANGAVIVDDSSASAHSFTPVGSVVLDTAKKTFGSTSMKFPGTTGSHINGDATASADFTFGTGDFTIDFHINFGSVAGTQVIYDGRPASSTGVWPLLFLTGSNLQWFVSNAARITGAPAGGWAISTDYHVAIVRASGSTIMYVNGTQVGSTYTDANSYLVVPNLGPRIGESVDAGSALNANVDEFRISKGIARWTSSFTPPALAYS